MPIRSLNGLDYSVRSLNGLSNVIDYNVSLPLTMDSDYNIKLSNLNSYGNANQILKMNSTGTALEYATESDTTYTNGTNISISNENVISSDQQTTLTFNSGQKLRGIGTSPDVRDIAYVDSNNDIIFGDSQNNCGFLVANGIFFYGDGTPLISNLRVFNSSGLNNTGIINNLSGNINLKNGNKINFNNDANNSIGSQGAPLAGVELKGFNNVLIKTSETNKPSINVGQTAIKCKGKITAEFLTGTTERDLLEVLTDNSIQLGDADTDITYVCSGGLYINSVVNPVISGTGTANLQGLSIDAGNIDIQNGNLNMINGTNIYFNGIDNNDNLNFIGSSIDVGGVWLQGAGNVKIGTQNGNTSAILTVKENKINCKGKISGQYTYNGTERDLLQVLTDNSIQLGDADTDITYVCSSSSGLYINSVVNPVISGDGTANFQGLSMDAGNIDIQNGNLNMINGTNIYFNGIDNNDNLNSIGSSTAIGGVYLQGAGNVKIGTQNKNASAILTVQQTKINCKGKISGQYTYNGTERDLLQLTQNEDIEVGDAGCEITVKGSNIDFEGTTTSFNGDLQMVREKYLYFDVGLLSNNNWIKATSEDGQDGLKIQGSADVLITTETFGGEIYLNGNTLEISANLTTYDNDITTTNSDLTIDGDFTGADCDISIDGDIKLALLSEINLNRSDTTTVYNYIRANGNIALNNTPGSSYGNGGGTEIKGFDTVLLSQSFNTSVNNAEFWISGARATVSATTFRYPTGGGSGSDDRIKFNEIPVDFDCLEIIKNLQVEVYDKHFIKDKNKFMDREIGIIAQDTYNKIKNLVNSDTADLFVSEIDYTIPSNFKENGDIVENQMKRVIHTDMVTGETTETIEENILAVSYIRFISVLIKSQQQQYFLEKSNNQKLEEKINKLEEQINKQQEQINILIKQINI